MNKLQISDVRIGVEPAERAPRLERIVLPLADGEGERHVLALTAALARAAHAEVLLVAADAVATRGPAKSGQVSTGTRPSAPTILSTSRSLARGEDALRARGVRVSGYLVRAAADAVSLVRRVTARQHVSMVVLPTRAPAQMGIRDGMRAALAMGVPTLLVRGDTANPWTSAILQRTTVILPHVPGVNVTAGLLWAEALAQCSGRSIVELHIGRGPGARAQHASAQAFPLEARATWPAAGVHLRAEMVDDYARAIAELSRHAISIVVLPHAPGQREDHGFDALLRALEHDSLPTLVVPSDVTPSAGVAVQA
ncbi:MAG TPA: hypothetical protein VET66_01310, partial [Steroidobacteraceae bacterium]|nr:hypothetical protein [Steroidobacteraceae bacterium]